MSKFIQGKKNTIYFVSQAKLITSVKKGKSVRHSAHRISPKISILADKRFSSCYKLARH